MLSALLPPKMEKGPKSAPKFFSDSFQFLAESCVLRPPLCIKKPFCEAVLRVLAGSCTQNSTPFHIFSFFMKTHSGFAWFKVPKALCASTGACAMYTRSRASGGFEVIVLSQNHIVRMYLVQTHCSSCAVYSNRCRRCSPKVDMLCLPCYTGYTDCKRRIFA